MFSERKKEMLEKIADHIADMQKRQSCVQAAADIEAMRACFPRLKRDMPDDKKPEQHPGNQQGPGPAGQH